MKAGWEVKKLGDVCSLITRGIAPKYIESGGICVLNQKCVRDHSINFGLARRNNLEQKKVPDERLIQIGDVLVNSTGTGTLGRVAQVLETPTEATTIDTHVTIVRSLKDLFYPAFFGYMLIKIEDELIAAGQGTSGQTELPKKDLENKFKVCYPTDIEQQKRIVSILDEACKGLDRAQQNAEANLKNARELFVSTLSSKLPLPGDAQLKVGWEVKALGDVATLQRGFDLPKKKRKPGEYPLVTSSGPTDTHNTAKVKGPGVVTGRSGSIGKVYYIEEDFWPLNTALYIKDFHNNDQRFIWYLLQAFNLNRFSSGTGVPTLNRNHVHSERVVIPSDQKEQKRIVAVLDEVLQNSVGAQCLYRAKIQDISDLRQSLLQKAFAGELT